MDISLDIPFTSDKIKPNESICSIYDCLKAFVKPEQLKDTEKYICNFCGSTNSALKKFTIDTLPSLLCLHLKRFTWDPRTKISNHIEFPFDLDLSEFTTINNKNSKYKLFSVISHHGKGTSYGHYTAHCLNNNEWMHYDDSRVVKSSENEVAKSQAYILFFNRVVD